ncbi:MAG: hypothetical protein DWH81_15870 [Planctomycetota bacterium]|nr:MAG: hypothetical protein DWH81_15870 [Planctomycetota bacterium]
MSDRLDLINLPLLGDDANLLTPRIQNRNLDISNVTHEATRSCNDSAIVSLSRGDDHGLSYQRNRLSRLDKNPWTPVVSTPASPISPHWTTLVARSLLYATILAGAGCGLGQGGTQEYSEAEKKAQLDKLLAAYPAEPADTPEQTRKKETEVEEKLPRVTAMLEELKTDPARVDEVVELSMNLVALAPKHRAANVAYCKAQLASFFAKEGKDHYNAWVAISSAAREIERFREIFDDLSEDERKLFQEVYFNQARREGYFPDGENAPEAFETAIENLMGMGFRDAERLRTEPKFAYFHTDQKFAPVLEAAIKQIEGSAADDPPK